MKKMNLSWYKNLIQIVKRKDWIQLGALLDKSTGQQYERFDSKSDFALRHACLHNQIDIVRKLILKPYVNPESKNNGALFNATRAGNVEIVYLLLKTGRVNVTARNHLALRLALTHRHFEIADMLLTQSAYLEKTKQYIVQCILLKDNHLVWTLRDSSVSQYFDSKGFLKAFFEMESKHVDEQIIGSTKTLWHAMGSFLFKKYCAEHDSFHQYSLETMQSFRRLQCKVTHYYALETAHQVRPNDWYYSYHNYFRRFSSIRNFYMTPIRQHFDICWKKNTGIAAFLNPMFLRACGYIDKPVLAKKMMRYRKERLGKEIGQAIQLTIGLAHLNLPVLLLQQLFEICDAMNRCLGEYLTWKIIQTVKL